MKRKCVLMMLLCTVLMLAGCGNSEAVNTDEAKANSEVEETEEIADEEEEVEEEIQEEPELTEEDIAAMVSEGIDVMFTDRDKALELFEEAAALGNEDAMFLAGYIYDWGYGDMNMDDERYKKAREYYVLVEDTNPYVMICSGYNYLYGQGVEADEEKAEEFFSRGVELIDVDTIDELEYSGIAYYLMAYIYEGGHGVDEDLTQSLEYAQKAADAGYGRAMYKIGSYYYDSENENQDYALAKEWFEKGAACGDAYSMYYLGYMYYHGEGVEQDYETASIWFAQAAESGAIAGYSWCGGCYYYLEDYTEAKNWFEMGAEKGNKTCMYRLGLMYYNGEGAEQDYETASTWFAQAAELDAVDSYSWCGICYYYLEDYAEAKNWFEMGAEKGDETCMYYLGWMYYKGKGVDVDWDMSREWLDKAAEAGSEAAQQFINEYFETN